jgi:glutathione S-transferase
MADTSMWQDKQARAAFKAKAQARLAELTGELAGQQGVIALEPESGDYFVGPTLGKANDAAYAKYPDIWVYFARLDDSEAALPLATW